MNKKPRIVKVETLSWKAIGVIVLAFAIMQCITVIYLSTKPKNIPTVGDGYIMLTINGHRISSNIDNWKHWKDLCDKCKAAK